MLPLCAGSPVAGLAFVGEPFDGLPLAEVPLLVVGLLLMGLRAVGEPVEPFDCATIQDAVARKKIRSAVLAFMIGPSKISCVMFRLKRLVPCGNPITALGDPRGFLV